MEVNKQYINQIGGQDIPPHTKRSENEPKLPKHFKVGGAVGGGDCFFDAVAQGISQLKPQMDFTIKYLRKVCRENAVKNEQIKEKVVKDARNTNDPTVEPPDPKLSDNDLWNAYLVGIEYDRDDITIISRDNPYFHQALTSSEYGSTLQAPIWGRPDIEGIMICQNFNINLHVIEKSKLVNDGWLHQTIKCNGSQSVEEVDYNDMNTIHILNKGNAHFEPILRTEDLEYDIPQHSSSSEDDDILTPEQELIYTIKSEYSEGEKMRRLTELLKRTPKLDVNFQDKKFDSSLHIAVRKGEKQIIEFLITRGAKINAKNKRGRTPLDTARKRKMGDIIQQLEVHLESNQRIFTGDQSVSEQDKFGQNSKESKQDCVHHKLTDDESNTVRRLRVDENDIGGIYYGSTTESRAENTNDHQAGEIKLQIQKTSIISVENQLQQDECNSLRNEVQQLTRVMNHENRKTKAINELSGSSTDHESNQIKFKTQYTSTISLENEWKQVEHNSLRDQVQELKGKLNHEKEESRAVIKLPILLTGYEPNQIRFQSQKTSEVSPQYELKQVEYNSLGEQFQQLKGDLNHENRESKGDNIPSVLPTDHEPDQRILQTQKISKRFVKDEIKKVEYNSSRNPAQEQRKVNYEEREPESSVEVGKFPKKILGAEKYAASGAKQSLHGTVYQIKLLMLFLKRALDKKYSFLLATEMDAADKFDDIAFMYENERKDGLIYRFLQAKHKQSESKKITIKDLIMKTDGEFSLQKYFTSYRNIIKNLELSVESGELKDLVICTNIDIESDLEKSFTSIESEDVILDVKSKTESRRLKLDLENSPHRGRLLKALEETSNGNHLARSLAQYLSNGKPLDLEDEFLKSYLIPLSKKVINVNIGKFYDSFIQRDLDDGDVLRFRKVLLCYLGKQTDDILLKMMSEMEIKISERFRRLCESVNNLQFKSGELEGLVNMVSSAIIKSKDGVVKIEKEESKKNGVSQDNIKKLAGHVLVKRMEKDKNMYYFSSVFLDENSQLHYDLETFRRKLKEKLSSKGIEITKDAYKFQINNFLTWTEEQLSLPNDYVNEEDIRSFFEKLVFAVNQPNEAELTKIIEEELSQNFSSLENSFAYSLFQKEILHWMKEKEGVFLSHKEGEESFTNVKRSLAKLELRSLALKYKNDIKRFGIEFVQRLPEVDAFLACNDKRVFNVVNTKNTKLSAIKVLSTLENLPEYEENTECVFIGMSYLVGEHVKDKTLKVFELGTYKIMVIECEVEEGVDVNALYEALKKAIERSIGNKIILISQPDCHLARKFKNDFSKKEYEELEDKQSKVTDLTIESQNKLLKEEKVEFQGKELSLDLVIDEGSKCLVDVSILNKLNHKKIVIGKEIPDLKDIEDYYINRVLYRHDVISPEYFKKINKQDIVHFSNTEQNVPPYLTNVKEARHSRSKNSDTKNPLRFVVLNSNKNDKRFVQQSRDCDEHNIHWISKINGKFKWQQTHGTFSELRDFLDRNNPEEYEADEVTTSTERTVIISAEPGMGKSTLLTNIAKETKESDNSLWVVRVDLNECTKELNKINESLNRQKAINFLLKVAGLDTNLERKLLQHRITTQGKVCLYLDGFDEISPTYKATVIYLVKILQTTKIEKLWITTRTHMRDELEDKLSVLSYSLKSFSTDDQKNFLRRYWSKKVGLDSNIHECRLNIYVNNILDVLSNSVADKEMTFSGIPLQTRLLAEAFQSNCKEFYASNLNKPHLPKKLNLVELYEHFVEKKFYIYCEEKLKQDLTIPGVNEKTKELYKKIVLRHKHLALTVIFQAEDLLQFPPQDRLGNYMQKGDDRTGIIEEFSTEGVRFIHRTFAEYFAAQYFVDEVVTRSHFKESTTFCILEKALFANEVLRTFFDLMLIKKDSDESKCEFLEAIIKNDMIEVEKFLSNSQKGGLVKCVDYGGRTALHLAAAYGNSNIVQILLKYEADVDLKDSIFGWTPLKYADKCHSWDVTEILLNSGADSNDMVEAVKQLTVDNISDSSTPLLHTAAEKGFLELTKLLVEKGCNTIHIAIAAYKAIMNGHLSVVKYLLKEFHFTNDSREFQTCQSSFVGLACRSGNLELVKYLIDDKNFFIDAKDERGFTPLHCAVRNGNLHIVKFFVNEKRTNVNDCDSYDRNAIQLAASEGQINVLKYLLDEVGSNVDLVQRDGNTLLHYACASGNLELVKYLVNEKEMSINTKNKVGKIPLHYAAEQGCLEILKFLMTLKRTNVNDRDSYGRGAVHLAASKGQINVLKYLLDEVGSDVDLVQRDGNTLLHYACASGNLELIKYLVNEKEMNINTKGEYDEIPFHWAARNGNLGIVKFLVTEKGANVNDRNIYGRGAVHLAALEGQINVVKYLLDEVGSNVDLIQSDGFDLVLNAHVSGNLELVKYLLMKMR